MSNIKKYTIMDYKKALVLSIAFVFVFFTLRAQDSLFIGKTPPPLKVEQWLNGEPQELLKKNHIYIIDFWALWCGPCIAGIPHLNELQKKYPNQLTIIGITNKDEWGNTLDKVKEFVAARDIAYPLAWVAESRPHEGMTGIFVHEWMRRANTMNLPQIMVVDQKGKIAFIGEPQSLPAVIDKLIEGNYDLSKAKKSYQARMESDALLDVLKKKLEVNDLEAAFQTASSLFQNPWLENPRIFSRLAGIINESAPGEPSWTQLSISSAQKAVMLSNFQESGYLDGLGDAYARAGKTFEAVLTESLAVKLSEGSMQREQLKKLKGYITKLRQE